MEPSLVSTKFIRSSDKGHVTIPEAKLIHADDPTSLADKLSAEYAKLVEENPDYKFGIIHDIKNDTVVVSWEKR
jgi:hypothetical protein